ncbi:MAG: hypothetical protein QW594_00305 [Candidatus Woesearchaeota archaeon]
MEEKECTQQHASRVRRHNGKKRYVARRGGCPLRGWRPNGVVKWLPEPMRAATKSSIVLASASTRSFRLAMRAMSCNFLGPRMGQVPLSQCKAQTPVAFLMLLM